MKIELADIERKLDALMIPVFAGGLGFETGKQLLTVALREHVGCASLMAIEKALRKSAREGAAPISTEAYGWLQDAVNNLSEFTDYATRLVDLLYDQKEKLEAEL